MRISDWSSDVCSSDLDDEAFRRLDVLEVDAAEGGFERGDDLDQLVGVALVDLDVEHVDAGELLEQHALAFKHRLAGQRADVAQATHRGAVRSAEHTSELQSLLRISYAVFCLKKKKNRGQTRQN